MVAIALTLLVLQLKVPVLRTVDKTSSSALWRHLVHTAPQLVAYLVSFYVIAAFWLVHHRVYRLLRGHHESIAWWNCAFLFTITLFPFSAALLGSFSGNPLAVVEFALNMLLASLATTLVVVVAHRKGLLVDAATPTLVRSMVARGLAAALVIAMSIPVALVAPFYVPFVWVLLAVSSPWVERRELRRAS